MRNKEVKSCPKTAEPGPLEKGEQNSNRFPWKLSERRWSVLKKKLNESQTTKAEWLNQKIDEELGE